jgi:hypothetical protein
MEPRGIAGLGNEGLTNLARKLAINTPLSLAVKGVAGSCVLLCFGISLESIQQMIAWCYSVWNGTRLKQS